MQEVFKPKPWNIKAGTGEHFEFYPIFLANKETGEVECQEIHIKFNDKTYKFNYENLYMFMYFVSNEELRRKLMQRYEKQIYEIPYNVTFKLDKAERDSGVANRHIRLKVDEIAMAMVKSEANFIRAKNPELQKIFKSKQ